jgi:hypothetical protein
MFLIHNGTQLPTMEDPNSTTKLVFTNIATNDLILYFEMA